MGLNFFKDSPRYITAAKAAEIVCELPPFVEPVAVFVNEPIHQIKKTMAQLGLGTFQWHVGRSPDKDYSLNDFRKQFVQMAEMGGMGELMKMVPGMDDMIPEWEDADAATGRIEKMIDSMTDEERKEPGLIDTQARQRIATAAGIEPDEVKRFLNQFEQVRLLMRQMAEMSMWQKLKMITGMGKAGMFEKTTDHADSVLPISVRPLRVIAPSAFATSTVCNSSPRTWKSASNRANPPPRSWSTPTFPAPTAAQGKRCPGSCSPISVPAFP